MRFLRVIALATVVVARVSVVHAQTVDFDALTIADINTAFDSGKLTSEQLVQLSLARIKAYDRQGPMLHAIITLNPKALETARALDAERKATGKRSPLHGIPVVLKDNFDTFDMPTTGGSVLLEGSIPPADAFVVKKLRDAGAIILAKVNMSEFASAAAMSSIIGQSLNPHDLTRTPSGSSGGTGVSIAAAYATIGLGTDTGGSIRGPASANGIAALKPTHGLLSRNGIIPLALSFDTGGPFARNVADVATALGVMTGVDPADDATKKSEGRFERDYTRYLNAGALKGARIGVARDFTGADADVDWIFESSIEAMTRAGATVIDVRYPKWLLDARTEFYNAVRWPEFPPQIAKYLSTLGPKYPKNITEMIERVSQFTAPRGESVPNPSRWALFKREADSGSMTDPKYVAVHDHILPAIRTIVDGLFTGQKLDAIIYPTSSTRPSQIASTPGAAPGPSTPSATNIANLTGFPDLIVPAGFTSDRLPVTISFTGPAFSEPKLIAVGYAFEQATKARRRPVNTPLLPGETIVPK